MSRGVLDALPASAKVLLQAYAQLLRHACAWARSVVFISPQQHCTALVVHHQFRWQVRQPPIQTTPPPQPPPVLPDDVAPHLLSFLDAEQLCIGASVCKRWFFCAYADRHWTRLCVRDFHVHPSSVRGCRSKEIGSRTLYMRLHASKTDLLRCNSGPALSPSARVVPVRPISSSA